MCLFSRYCCLCYGNSLTCRVTPMNGCCCCCCCCVCVCVPKQNNAEECVRRAISRMRSGSFEYRTDAGACVRVAVAIDPAKREAHVDFAGTSPQAPTNFNAPWPVCRAATMYVFRTLVDDDIPMNEGCMRAVRLDIPEGSMLRPAWPAAVVAGNVETSQVVTDALLGALGVAAASQGTMNNVTFGNDRYQYYETVCGGAGAGPHFRGQDAVVSVRMTERERGREGGRGRGRCWRAITCAANDVHAAPFADSFFLPPSFALRRGLALDPLPHCSSTRT